MMKTTKSVASSKTQARRTTSLKSQRPKNQQIDNLMRLMTHETGKSIEFEVAAAQGSKVYVAGTFNNWDPTTHPLRNDHDEGVFKATLHLPVGTHEYKFVVNGVWQMDAKREQWSPNEHGSLNSVLRI